MFKANTEKRWKYVLLLVVIFVSLPSFAQTVKITGRVQDINGDPLIGATVSEKGTQNRAVTDVNGTYNITVKDSKAVLMAEYIGFQAAEKRTVSTLIDFILQDDVSKIDEVVVTGYSTAKKVSVLGAQSSLKMEQVKAPVANLSSVLAGRVSGVVSVQRTGVPGRDDSDIWIRGISTLTNRNEGPLVLVDGIERSFSNLDPEDIESITVLKDAASTAVYGVRGGNGVIIITTKPGIVSKPKFSFDIYQGVTQLTQIPDLVDGIEYMHSVNEAYMNSRGRKYYSDNYIANTKIANGLPLTAEEQAYAQTVVGDRTINKYLYPNVDWMKELYHDLGWNRRANVNIRGGAPNASYYISLSYFNEKGLTKSDPAQDYSSEITFNRYNFLTNVNLKATKTTNIDVGVSGWLGSGNYPNQSLGNIFGRAMNTNPVIYPVQYPGGQNPGISPTNRELDSPWVYLTRRGYQTQTQTQINTNLKLQQDLGFWNWSKGLSVRALVAFDVRANQNIHYAIDDSTWRPYGSMDPSTGVWIDDDKLYDADGNLILEEKFRGNSTMNVQSDKWVYRTFYFESALDYRRTFNKLHNIGFLTVFSLRSYLDANGSSLFTTLPYKEESLSARLTYDFDNRYFAEVNVGYTGSENFEAGHRFGTFPAFAVGWVASNEKWWKPLSKYISFLKFRLSDGVVGNDSSGERFSYFTKIEGGNDYSTYWRRNGASGGLAYSNYGYKAQWSKIHKIDLGIEVNFLNDDLCFVFDIFHERRSNIFVSRANVPLLEGFARGISANVGVVKNRGFEASFDYSHQFGKDLYISVRGNMTSNRDEVVENAQAVPAYPWLDQRGHNVLAEWGYTDMGLFSQEELDALPDTYAQFGINKSQLKPGDIRYKDLNGDGVIDEYDRSAISRGDVPRMYYGFGGDFRYKNIGLGVLFQGVHDAERILRGNGILPFQSSQGGGTLYANISDRWSADNPDNENVFYPRLGWGATDVDNINNYQVSTWWKRDFSFMRLKQLTLSYYFPKAWQGSIIKGGRFYIMGSNLLTWSKFKLWDPELNTDNGISYPNVTTVSLGVNFNL